MNMVELGTVISPAKVERCGLREYPVLSMTMHDGLIFQNEKFKKSVASKDKSTYKVVFRNQLVISFPIDEGVLAAQRITDAGIVSPAYGIWDIDQEKIIPEYLEYALRCERAINYYKAKLRGSTARRRSLPTPTLLAFQIPLPELQEQSHMIEVLHLVQDIISHRKRQLEELDTLVKSQFVEMFGDPVFNPFGFEQSTLRNVSKTKLSYGSGAAAVRYDGETRYVRITDITDNGSLNNDFKSPASVDEKYLLNDGDILFARTGATVGKTFEYKKEYGRCIFAGFLIRLVPDTTKVLPSYVYAFTQSAYYKKFVAETQRVVAQPNINAQEYGDLTICVPPIDKQREFEKLVQQADQSKFAINQSLEKLETLKKALMQDYFE